MNTNELELLKMIADIDGTPSGAFNIRANGALASRNVTENINIREKADGNGIEIIIKPNTKGEKVHIPVIISETDLKELVIYVPRMWHIPQTECLRMFPIRTFIRVQPM